MVVTIVFAVLLFLSALPAWATDRYYCSTGGSDSNPGTEASPFSTNDKFNTDMNNAACGDRFFLCRGGSWTANDSTDNIDFVNKSCSAGNPITVSAYGSGALPIWNGNNSPPYGAYCTNSTGVVIENIDIRNWGVANFRIEGCDQVIIRNNTVTSAAQTCIKFMFSSTRPSSNGEIYNNTISGCGSEGIYLGDGANTGDFTHDVYVHDNSVINTGRECFEIKAGVSNARVEHNYCDNNATANLSGQRFSASAGGFTSQLGIGNTVKFNMVRRNGNPTGNLWNGFGPGITMRYNIFADGNSNGIVFQDSSNTNQTQIVEHNTVYNAASAAFVDNTGGDIASTANNLYQGNGSGNNCSGAGNTMTNPASGDFSLPAASNCQGNGALVDFSTTAAEIESSGTTVLVTFNTAAEVGPIQCPGTPSSVSLDGCSISGSQNATACEPVGTMQVRMTFPNTVAQGETTCVLNAAAGVFKDSAMVGGTLATFISPQNGESLVISQSATNNSTGGEFLQNLLTTDNLLTDCANCEAGRGCAVLIDGDVTSFTSRAGNIGITSFSCEYDLGIATSLALFRAFCDGEGNRQTENVTLEGKLLATDTYVPILSESTCDATTWFEFVLPAPSARYVRMTYNCPACAGTEAAEHQLFASAGVPPGGRSIIRRSGFYHSGKLR